MQPLRFFAGPTRVKATLVSIRLALFVDCNAHVRDVLNWKYLPECHAINVQGAGRGQSAKRKKVTGGASELHERKKPEAVILAMPLSNLTSSDAPRGDVSEPINVLRLQILRLA